MLTLTKLTGISIAFLSILILGAAYLQNITALILIFVVGAIMAPPLISVALVVAPIRWAQQASRPWRIAAALPAISLAMTYVGLLAPAIKVFEWARSNVGPPVLFGIWAWSTIAYMAIFATVCPYPKQEDLSRFP